jgi:predicted HD phosphohydrolase
MRIIGEIPHPQCKITLYHWNNRYVIKVEKGYFEQTFKVDQFELTSENDLHQLINNPFMEEVVARFDAMEQSLALALKGL